MSIPVLQCGSPKSPENQLYGCRPIMLRHNRSIVGSTALVITEHNAIPEWFITQRPFHPAVIAPTAGGSYDRRHPIVPLPQKSWETDE